PLHNPSELKVINIFKKKLPKVKNVAAFDTSFHTTIPAINHVYPINEQVAKKYEIRRYGYHGVSYKFITKKMQEILGKKSVNLIVCHIGNGASICAIKDSKSFDTSMGLTPLEGVMMGTRCGSIDPSIATYLFRMGMDDKQIDNLFNKESGMYGFIGSADLRDAYKLAAKGNKKAIFAIELYVNRVTEYIVKYANELECKVDAVVFTAGVGENQYETVKKILDKIKLFNMPVDMKKLVKPYDEFKLITTAKAKFPAYMVRTDEELMIAQDVKRLTKK
ncbi:MAG: acetate/propionate family kinase, partial [Mycoplasmoidaceae bacterium]|nr:acetate/propionate family kinase [Mycoplasmoidaceae bacterium]